jgi:hypothetical protein
MQQAEQSSGGRREPRYCNRPAMREHAMYDQSPMWRPWQSSGAYQRKVKYSTASLGHEIRAVPTERPFRYRTYIPLGPGPRSLLH